VGVWAAGLPWDLHRPPARGYGSHPMAQQRPSSGTKARNRSGRGRRVGPLGALARTGALAGLLWIGGFILFVMTLPGPATSGTRTEGVVVLTGGPGRVSRGVAVLKDGLAQRLLVSGVHPSVKPAELGVAAGIPDKLNRCCVDLGFKADSTRSNAQEVSEWVGQHGFKTIRLVTAAYHMPRARGELEARLPADVTIVPDGVGAGLPLWSMLVEYAKFQASWVLLRVRPA
jgi:uncharacterized SAM-binding protein YcdF (DUF218 family)